MGSEDAVLCHARAELYHYLAAAAISPPAKASVAALRDPGNRAFLGESLGDPRLTGALADLESSAGADLKALSDEFHALFVVPGPRFCTPNESVFLDVRRDEDGRPTPGLLWGPQTLAVRAAYGRAGYQLEPGFNDLPDHIGAELLFMARLCEDESEALDCGEQTRAEQLAALQAEFMRDHLIRFASLLCARVEEVTSQAYFRTWAALLRAFLMAEARETSAPIRAP